MDKYESLSHTRWECKYHVVFIPKCRRKVLYGELRRHLGSVLRELAEQRECRIEEGYLMPDHVHMLIRFHRSTRWRRRLGTSKGRARFTLLEPSWGRSETSSVSTCGREVLRLNKSGKGRSGHSRVRPSSRGRGQAVG